MMNSLDAIRGSIKILHLDIVALFDSEKRSVSLSALWATPIEAQDHVLLSVAQVDRYMKKGCQAYMVFFSIQAKIDEGVKNIPIVKEFTYVFLDEVFGLLSEHEAEFSIELVPSIGLISKAPYWISPSELVELKKQIEELLKKDFTLGISGSFCKEEGWKPPTMY
ncbi:uncharacterized protein LOC129319591 [Prosopis cineraria]|uniref:uncharacterized protein LOC129319591 n=1 Tax=Prosopis cineraria TaxID=364024 RepID=UPI0024106335|nr:uncharacterized protein LOC129319591 [Prosopis cineraria]